MALTREFKETVMERIQNDPAYGEALLQQGMQAMLDGEIEVGKSMLRDVINATIGFETLGREVGKDPKSLMRMFSRGGNPNTGNFFDVLGSLQRHTGLTLEVTTARQA